MFPLWGLGSWTIKLTSIRKRYLRIKMQIRTQGLLSELAIYTTPGRGDLKRVVKIMNIWRGMIFSAITLINLGLNAYGDRLTATDSSRETSLPWQRNTVDAHNCSERYETKSPIAPEDMGAKIIMLILGDRKWSINCIVEIGTAVSTKPTID